MKKTTVRLPTMKKIRKIRKRKTLQQKTKILIKNQQVLCKADCQH